MRQTLVARSYLVAIGIALATILGTGFALAGISWINVDSLRAHPVLFTAVFLIPTVVAALVFLLALLPRVLQINLIVLLCLWMATEVVFGFVNWYEAPKKSDIRQAINGGDYVVPDAALGYRSIPNSTGHHVESRDGQQEFSVTYRFDSVGRRQTPVDLGKRRSNFLLFFGDSNTFGEGLEECQTLPYYAGQFATEYQPYNYGFSGWGPAQMLELVKNRTIPVEIKQREGFALFFFIQEHLGRVVGSSMISTDWGRDFPYYILDKDSRLVRHGDFAHDRQFITLFYYLVASSRVAQHFEFALPLSYTDHDYRLAAEIMAESQKYLKKQFKLRGFYVVLAPAFDEEQVRNYQRFSSHLRKAGVSYLDYTRLYDTSDVKYRLSEWNRHNSALANRIIAQQLVKDLGIGAAR